MSNVIVYVFTFVSMMVVNCPKYDNMSACLSMIDNISLYYQDYQVFYRDHVLKF